MPRGRPVQRVVDSFGGVPCAWIRPDSAPIRPGEPCGEIHEHCVAHTKAKNEERIERRGDPCPINAMDGQLVCHLHGGKAGQNLAKGQKRHLDARILGEVGELMDQAMHHLADKSGPEQLMLGIQHAGARALCYRWLLDELPQRSEWSYTTNVSDQGAMTRFVNVDTEGLLGPDQHGVQKLHAYEEGFRYWTKLHAELLLKAAALGLDERRQRFAEEQVRTIGAAVRLIVEGLGRDLDDPEVVPHVERALVLIAGEAS